MTGALAFTVFLVAVVVVCVVGLLLFAWDVLHRPTPPRVNRLHDGELFNAGWQTDPVGETDEHSACAPRCHGSR